MAKKGLGDKLFLEKFETPFKTDKHKNVAMTTVKASFHGEWGLRMPLVSNGLKTSQRSASAF